MRDGTRCLTRGAGSNRDQAEQAAALLLCEHPGVRRNLAKPQNHAKRKNSSVQSADNATGHSRKSARPEQDPMDEVSDDPCASNISSTPPPGQSLPASSTEWFVHNPKLYLLRYAEEDALRVEWDRVESGAAHCPQYTTTVRIAGAKDDVCETATARTKRDAESAAALAACRTLRASGLLKHPTRRSVRADEALVCDEVLAATDDASTEHYHADPTL